MAHNAGPGAVGRWKSIWARLRRLDDYEFVVDTVPYEETRGFARRALTALWIAGATPEGSPFKPSQSERGNTVR
jgi:soluble lytic murein transglycosylase-like protein